MLCDNASLRELYLGCNDIEEAGALALAHSWRANTALEKVDVQGARVGAAAVHAIAEALRRSSSLRQLVLDVEPALAPHEADEAREAAQRASQGAVLAVPQPDGGHSWSTPGRGGLGGLGPGRLRALRRGAPPQPFRHRWQHVAACGGMWRHVAAYGGMWRGMWWHSGCPSAHALTSPTWRLGHTQAIAAALRANTSLTELVVGESRLVDEAALDGVRATLRVNRAIVEMRSAAAPRDAAPPHATGAPPELVTAPSPPASPPPPLRAPPSPPRLAPPAAAGMAQGMACSGVAAVGVAAVPRWMASTTSRSAGMAPAAAVAAARRAALVDIGGGGRGGGGGGRSGGDGARDAVAAVTGRMEALAGAVEVRLRAQEGDRMHSRHDTHT